ncbi:ferrochelatase [Actinomadura parmotrematis]|uniref:Coproporphyrin III ferrochelatase n=1 Tax=Actinomadura parmotrematis TaxID=2864039 RepID=A0ABS7FWD4_9ACTN|nr:ferrochelatase [Actinomadura parmotrematis]MBW8484745.1 ferrochelatase [Actinomadura parmotrematis]
MSTYDALLLVSFGGPEGPDDVIPFLENVTRGRNIPRERLEAVGEHYHLFDGVSPINRQCRDLKAAIEADLAAHGIDLPVYWGNRNWEPYLADTVRTMRDDGVRRAAAFVTSAYSCYSCCRQYLDDIDRARGEVEGAPEIDKLRVYANHPGFVAPFVEATRSALADLPDDVRDGAHLAFSAHSVPLSQPGRESYVTELRDVAAVVAAEAAPGHPYELVYQSRSGPPSQPWLEPDILDHLEKAAAAGTRAVVNVPIGFTSDHMEVKYDLDVEATAKAAELGLAFRRAATPGTHPRFVAMVRELLLERSGDAPERPTVGALGARPDACPADCCRNGARAR